MINEWASSVYESGAGMHPSTMAVVLRGREGKRAVSAYNGCISLRLRAHRDQSSPDQLFTFDEGQGLGMWHCIIDISLCCTRCDFRGKELPFRVWYHDCVVARQNVELRGAADEDLRRHK